MIFSEFVFSIILLLQNKLSFQRESFQSEWVIIAIELLLGIAVFTLFFGISLGFRYLLPRIINRSNRKS
jgi:amino acid permease